MDLKFVAIITARGGSKGLPRKNVLPLKGKPLIAYTIEAAFESGVFSDVIVTTDCEEISRVSQRFGAQVINRPSELASDSASSLDVIEHALLDLGSQGKFYDCFMLLQPTSPLRNALHISNAWENYCSELPGSLVSVTEELNTPYKLLLKNEDGTGSPLFDWDSLTKPRQKLPKTYRINGAIYVAACREFLSDKNLFSAPLKLMLMDEISSLDIDTAEDFDNVTSLLD